MPRRPHRPLLRLAVFALFAIGLALQPLLASIGELHELVAHAATEHAHFDVAPTAAEQHAPAIDGAAEFTRAAASAASGDTAATSSPDALHALLHFAHCCGHTPAFALSAPIVVPLPIAALLPIMHASARVDRGRALTPFRPPIAA